MKIAQCECGSRVVDVYGVGDRCEWTGPIEDTVLVESMPAYLRATHAAAGNRGVWPHNGAGRYRMERGCAELAIENDPDWTSIVE